MSTLAAIALAVLWLGLAVLVVGLVAVLRERLAPERRRAAVVVVAADLVLVVVATTLLVANRHGSSEHHDTSPIALAVVVGACVGFVVVAWRLPKERRRRVLLVGLTAALVALGLVVLLAVLL